MDVMKVSSLAPIFFIENDWENCLRKISGNVWISCKFKDCVGNYGKITSLGQSGNENENTHNLKTTDGFDIDYFSSNVLCVKYNSNYKCMFLAPINVYSNIHKKSVTCISVNETTMCVSASTNNEHEILVWDKETGQTLLNLKGHAGDVYKCKWFPSNIVILSASSDMHLKIWCAKTGRCSVTLIGHTQAVTDVCIVDRGRNIISVSKDGTCKLWDCGQSCCIDDLIKVDCSLNCCAISEKPWNVFFPKAKNLSKREVGTDDKILLIGCGDGDVICLAISCRSVLFTLTLNSVPNCCCAMDDDMFAVGCRDGNVVLINGKSWRVITQWSETNSPALSMTAYKRFGFFTGYMDGSCVFRSVVDLDSNLRLQFSGPQDDPVYDISFDGRYVYTACRDSLIRRYFPEPYIENNFEPIPNDDTETDFPLEIC